MTRTLFIGSAVSLTLLTWFVVDDVVAPEYRRHQLTYREAILDQASSSAERLEAMSYAVRVRQIVAADLGRTDRCVSCHVGIEDRRMAHRPHPLKSHPGKLLEIHDIEKIGCTVCHDGQGRALTARTAHAAPGVDWDTPILPAPYLYAKCMSCHEVDEYTAMPPILRRGRDLFFSRGCLGCHRLEGQGGQIGPDLTRIGEASPHLKHPVAPEMKILGQKLGNPGIAYIVEALKLPSAQPADSAMMDLELTEDEITAIAVFLKGQSRESVPAAYLAQYRQRRRTEALTGAAIYDRYCVACHGPGGRGGVVNPNYARKTVPPLNTLAEKMFLEYQEDAELIADLLEAGTDIETMAPPLDVDGRARVLAQYRAVKDVIRKGSRAAKGDPVGPSPPLHMPRWEVSLTDRNIDDLIAWLLRQQPWEDGD